MRTIASLLASTQELKQIYLPVILRLNNPADKQIFDDLLKNEKALFVHDEMYGQLQELVKCKNPSIKIKPKDYTTLVNDHLKGQAITEYGVWVYYPWSRRLVHLLDEEEFIEVRTNRNQNKITRAEQRLLSTKKIGVVGLSVGQSIALTMAMERVCGEISLAEWDSDQLSNLN